MRVKSTPNFISCLPCVQVKLSDHSKFARCSVVGPWTEGPSTNDGPKITGGAGAVGAAGVTFVNPRSLGEVWSVGTACVDAKRLAAKRNSLILVLENVCVQVNVPIWLRWLSNPAEPTGTLPPDPSG